MTGLELRSTITPAGELVLNLEEVSPGDPAPDEVVVRIEAAPINPSDIGLLLGPADPTTMAAGGTPTRPVLTLQVPAARMGGVAARLGQSMPVGNEGAGTVVRAGSAVAHLEGKRVGLFGGGTYTQFRRLPARDCIVLPDGASAADGASMFVNPLTALSFLETMRGEGHRALVHTAAASNLGQMLVKLCRADGVPLVNVVRSPAQRAILADLGATHVVDSSADDFDARLADACAATGATLGFDAVGGGTLAGRILVAMEAALARRGGAYSRYGSATHKQVYLYGSLDTGPTLVDRSIGMSWGVGGYLVMNFLAKAGRETGERLRTRVAHELTTTFASRYTRTIGLAETLRPDVVAAYQRKATGEKFLIDPTRS